MISLENETLPILIIRELISLQNETLPILIIRELINLENSTYTYNLKHIMWKSCHMMKVKMNKWIWSAKEYKLISSKTDGHCGSYSDLWKYIEYHTIEAVLKNGAKGNSTSTLLHYTGTKLQ